MNWPLAVQDQQSTKKLRQAQYFQAVSLTSRYVSGFYRQPKLGHTNGLSPHLWCQVKTSL